MKNNTERYNTWFANQPRLGIIFTVLAYLLLGFIERMPGTYIPPLLYFGVLGILALYLMPCVLGLPNGRKSLKEYCLDIRLLPIEPVKRNIFLGLMVALLTLTSIYIASLITGYFQFDWSLVPGVRWVKGLTRGIWEEVFFRGIILVLFMRMFEKRRAIFLSAFLFAMAHLSSLSLDIEMLIDIVSIFFIGLLFTYMVLKTGALLPGIVFHYVYDIFVLLVQNTPGADQTQKLILLYSFLWVGLVISGLLTKYWVEKQEQNAI